MEKQTITFNGKEFVSVKNSTIEHDLWLMSQVRGAGLDQVFMKKGEAPEAFANRLLHETIASGRVFPILGGLLIPAEIPSEKWTPAIGLETAEHLKAVTDPEEKKAIQSTVVSALISFFANGLASAMTSPSYSTGKTENEPGSRASEER